MCLQRASPPRFPRPCPTSNNRWDYKENSCGLLERPTSANSNRVEWMASESSPNLTATHTAGCRAPTKSTGKVKSVMRTGTCTRGRGSGTCRRGRGATCGRTRTSTTGSRRVASFAAVGRSFWLVGTVTRANGRTGFPRDKGFSPRGFHWLCFTVSWFRDFWFVLCLGTQLGRKLPFCESLNRVILIWRRSSGQGFRLKDLRLRCRINQWSSAGRTTALWFLG